MQSVAVEGYETGEHAPGLQLRGTGAYRAAHHIIKVPAGTPRLIHLLDMYECKTHSRILTSK